jgi:hypothetical protein
MAARTSVPKSILDKFIARRPISLRVWTRRFNIGCLPADLRRGIPSARNDTRRVQPAVAAEVDLAQPRAGAAAVGPVKL